MLSAWIFCVGLVFIVFFVGRMCWGRGKGGGETYEGGRVGEAEEVGVGFVRGGAGEVCGYGADGWHAAFFGHEGGEGVGGEGVHLVLSGVVVVVVVVMVEKERLVAEEKGWVGDRAERGGACGWRG